MSPGLPNQPMMEFAQVISAGNCVSGNRSYEDTYSDSNIRKQGELFIRPRKKPPELCDASTDGLVTDIASTFGNLTGIGMKSSNRNYEDPSYTT